MRTNLASRIAAPRHGAAAQHMTAVPAGPAQASSLSRSRPASPVAGYRSSQLCQHPLRAIAELQSAGTSMSNHVLLTSS